MHRHLCALVLPCLALSACSGTPQLRSGASLTVVDSKQLPLPDKTDLTSRPYYVGPFDKLSIEVFGIQELTAKEVQVDAGGRISFPFAGILEVSGHTPGEVANMIETRLQDKYIRNPQVTVNLKEAVSQVITIEGEVREPGLFPVVGRMTLLRALATAKGTTDLSDLNKIVIFRTVGKQDYAALYDVRAIRSGAYPDPEVFANDIVSVGTSRSRRLFKDLLTAAPLLSTPLIILLN